MPVRLETFLPDVCILTPWGNSTWVQTRIVQSAVERFLWNWGKDQVLDSVIQARLNEEHLQLCFIYLPAHCFILQTTFPLVLILLVVFCRNIIVGILFCWNIILNLSFELAQCGQEGLSEGAQSALVICVYYFLVLISIPHNFYVVFHFWKQ